MKLTLNELKILKSALNVKLRAVCLESSEFINIKKSISKVNEEIKIIDNEIRQKACDESIKDISQFFKPKKDKMKAEFEFNLDSNGRPCIKFRHYDKSSALEQKALKVFIDAVKDKGMELRNISGHIDTEGNSWENYEVQICK